MRTRIPYLRAISADKRSTPIAIESVLAKTTLAGITRRAVADAFADAGLLCGGQMKAAAGVDDDGRYLLTAIDAALSKCHMPLSMAARIEIKNTLARCSLLQK
jgi:hypothetical protein